MDKETIDITVHKPVLFTTSIVIFACSLSGSMYLCRELTTPLKYFIPIISSFIVGYELFNISTAKMRIKINNDSLSFEWIQNFPFNKIEYSDLNVNSIHKIIIDNKYCLQKIITKNEHIAIYPIKNIPSRYYYLSTRLKSIVKMNGGIIMTTQEDHESKGYFDTSFLAVVGSILFCIAIIPRAWETIEERSLYLLFLIPVTFTIHKLIKKKGDNRV